MLPGCRADEPAPQLFRIDVDVLEVDGLTDDMHLGVIALCGSQLAERGLDPGSLSVDNPPDLEATAILTIDPQISELTWGERRFCASGETEAWAWAWVDVDEDGRWTDGEPRSGGRMSGGYFGFVLNLDGEVAP